MRTYERLLLALTLFFALILAWGVMMLPAEAQEAPPPPAPAKKVKRQRPRLPDGCVFYTLPDGRGVIACDDAHGEPAP